MKLFSSYWSLLTILLLSLNPLTSASSDHRGGNGGDSEELEMMKKATQISKFLESPTGMIIFGTNVNSTSFKNKVKQIDFQIVSEELKDKFGKIRTCLNYPSINQIKCNALKWENTSQDIQYVLTFHEVLNLLDLELGNITDPSKYPISSKLQSHINTVSSIDLANEEYRPEYYATKRESFGYRIKNQDKRESIRLICLRDNVPAHKCNNFNLVMEFDSRQKPLLEKVIALDKTRINIMMQRLDQYDFFSSLVEKYDRELDEDGNEIVNYDDETFLSHVYMIFNIEDDLSAINSTEEIDNDSYREFKKRLKKLLLTSLFPDTIHFDSVKITNGGAYVFSYPYIQLNDAYYYIGISDRIRNEFCALAGLKSFNQFSSAELYNDKEVINYVEIEEMHQVENNMIKSFEMDIDTDITSSLQCTN